MDNKNIPIQSRLIKEYNEASSIARFYGFLHFAPPEVHKTDLDSTKTYNPAFYPEEISALLRMYFEEKGLAMPQPLLLWLERPFKGGRAKKRPNRLESKLVSMGSGKTITDCLALRTCISILNSLGFKDLEIRLNSVGDKESASEFERKMNAYVKKNYNAFPADLRQRIKKDIFTLIREVHPEWQTFQAECPKSIDFLSESSRNHFKEVLEFLEIMNLNYTIDFTLVGDPHLCSETIFSLVSEKNPKETLATGIRVNKLSKKLGHKKDISMVVFDFAAKLKKPLHKVRAKSETAEFYLIQFGPEAKLKSLLIIEELRKAGKSLEHSVAKDKLGSQIGIAENSGAKYILLLGQKEALDNSVVLRHNSTRAQEIIPIPELANRLKNL